MDAVQFGEALRQIKNESQVKASQAACELAAKPWLHRPDLVAQLRLNQNRADHAVHGVLYVSKADPHGELVAAARKAGKVRYET
jgi:hypothetical protein